MSQIRLLQTTGPATSAGTAMATQNPTEGAAWSEVTGLGTIPPGGALLDVLANGGAAIRVAVMPPPHSTAPPHNGDVVHNAASYQKHIPTGARVWTRQL